MTDHYLPVPVWNNRLGCWQPVDFPHEQRVTIWPDGFDPARLPQPEYRDGERVQFVRNEACAREGVVRMVMLRGGGYGPLERVEQQIERWYCRPECMIYIVTARGHDLRLQCRHHPGSVCLTPSLGTIRILTTSSFLISPLVCCVQPAGLRHVAVRGCRGSHALECSAVPAGYADPK
ncbi:MAG TPA: hypothetical protein VIZ18_18365 [Ktedonobacteraceae bacterium]